MIPPTDQEEWTVADAAEQLSGIAYELVEGQVMARSPNRAHTAICEEIVSALRANCPKRYFVGADRLLWLDAHNEFRPSVVIVSREDSGRGRVPIKNVMLVIDVLSEFVSYAETDAKAAVLTRAGVPAYWVVDQHRDNVWLGDVELDPARMPGMLLNCQTDTRDVFVTTQPWLITLNLPKLTARRAAILADFGSCGTASRGR